jgi:NLR family CARD domain-containing protein 3
MRPAQVPAALRELELCRRGVPQGFAAALAQHCTQLRSLVHHLRMHFHVPVSAALALAQSLAAHTCLQTLDLAGAEMGDAGFTALAQVLAQLTALRSLSLESCQLSDASSWGLVAPLQGRLQLRTLHLGCNALGGLGLRAIARSIRGLPRLREVDNLALRTW